MSTIGKFPDAALPEVTLLASAAAQLDALRPCADLLAQFGVGVERELVPVLTDAARVTREAAERGVRALIVAGADDRLASALATEALLPVIRVPIPAEGSTAERGLDLFAAGIRAEAAGSDGGFATVAIGEAGARNAGLFVISILALTDSRLRAAWQAFRDEQTAAVLREPPLQ